MICFLYKVFAAVELLSQRFLTPYEITDILKHQVETEHKKEIRTYVHINIT